MNVKKILFATDFSDPSDSARNFASSLARDSGATLLIVHVFEPSLPGDAYGLSDYSNYKEEETDARNKLTSTLPTYPEVSYLQILLEGDPCAEIVRYAEQEKADVIVIGSHGHTGIVRMLMGSVAESIVRSARCPVITVKQPNLVADKVEI